MKNLETTPHKIIIYISITESKQARDWGGGLHNFQKILNKNKTNS